MGHLTDRELDILSTLKKEPMISQEELAARLNISRSAAAVHISNLIKKGAILGRGYVFNERTGIVVIGGSYIVIIGKQDKQKETKYATGTVNFDRGGTAINLAERLGSLKVPTLFISALGIDESGDQLVQRLHALGVNTHHIIRSANHRTGRRIEIVDDEKNTQYILEDRDVDNLISSAWLESKWHVIQKADFLALDTELNLESFKFLVDSAQKTGLRVCVNAFASCKKGIDLRLHLSKITVLVIELKEAEELVGYAIKDEDKGLKAAMDLVNAGVEAVVIVLGNQGAVLATCNEAIVLPVLSGRLSTEIMAGEVIAGGMLYGLANGYSYRQAARIGLGAAQIDYKAREKWELDWGQSLLNVRKEEIGTDIG